MGGICHFSASGTGVKTDAWDISELAMQQVSEPSDGAVIACGAELGKGAPDSCSGSCPKRTA
ncbi:MAG: hypothetical protein EPO01_10740 [Aquabacterium sp.]|nr:MAG: hypothetical protein EPO01_10740 [Aquabacterium sp.]